MGKKGKIGEILADVASPLIGGATSLFAGIRSSRQQQKIIAQQIEAQRKENEAQRRYNLMLAEKQNQWNIEQWQRNNDYNAPSAVMSRLRSAGINPHMYYSRGNAMGGVSTSSPEMTSGSPAEAVDTSGMLGQRTFGQSVQMAMDKAVQVASIRKMNADTRLTEQKADTEKYNTDIFESDAAFRNALNGSQLNLNGMEIQLKGSMNNLTEQQVGFIRYQCAEIDKKMEQIDQQNEMMRAEIDLMTEQKKSVILQRALDSANVAAVIDKLAAETELTREQARDIVATRGARILNINADTALKGEQTHLAKNQAYSTAWDTKRKHFELDFDQDMASWRKTMEQVDDVVDASQVLSSEIRYWMQYVNDNNPVNESTSQFEQTFDSKGNLKGSKSVERSFKRSRK